MKKILLFILCLILGSTAFSIDSYNLPMKDYKYPIENPYLATIYGNSTLMTEGVSKKVPRRNYKIDIPGQAVEVETLWFQKKFGFSLSKQKGKAPLIFVIGGTGANYYTWSLQAFARIFHDAGYHVVTVSSPFSTNFIVTASNLKMPGLIYNDASDIYNVMEHIYDKIKDKVEITDFYLTGYSMGATESAFVSLIDEEKKVFNFKRVFMINPSVNLYTSSELLDDMLERNLPKDDKSVIKFADNVINNVVAKFEGNVQLDEKSIYEVFKENRLEDEQMEALIGLAFRIISNDLNYTTDVIHRMHVFVEGEPKRYDNLLSVLNNVSNNGLDSYVKKLALPYYQDVYGEEATFEEIVKRTDLADIRDYLATSDKIAVVTNADEIILTEDNLEFIKNTFKDRAIIYPTGGHCGNMFYSENIEVMLKFFKEGVL